MAASNASMRSIGLTILLLLYEDTPPSSLLKLEGSDRTKEDTIDMSRETISEPDNFFKDDNESEETDDPVVPSNNPFFISHCSNLPLVDIQKMQFLPCCAKNRVPHSISRIAEMDSSFKKSLVVPL
jgi:hypothetical protein